MEGKEQQGATAAMEGKEEEQTLDEEGRRPSGVVEVLSSNVSGSAAMALRPVKVCCSLIIYPLRSQDLCRGRWRTCWSLARPTWRSRRPCSSMCATGGGPCLSYGRA